MGEYTIKTDRRQYYKGITFLHIDLCVQHSQNPSVIFIEVDELNIRGNMNG